MSISLTSARPATTSTTGPTTTIRRSPATAPSTGTPAARTTTTTGAGAPTTPDPRRAAEGSSRIGGAVVVDLSGLGAAVSDPEADLPVDTADLPRLARHAHAARQAGIAEVALSPAFHLRSDAPWRTDAGSDARRTGERLTDAGVDVLLPGAAAPTAGGPTAGAGLTADSARRASASRARTAGAATTVGARVRTAPYVDSVAECEAAGRLGGTVIVRAVHHERVAEFVAAVRRGAAEAGADVRVLVELHVAIAETRERALARTELVADIAAVEQRELPWSGSAAVIGSAEDVLAEARSFAALADGLVLVPISVPADLTAILTELV
ncbi:hypothetical protein ACPYO6_00225 [Georgenia sp. Z1344]|uniref:hypothetical protein n=1 Tax=Georgenia sp. Z1344 TaxID=3416706 RepID=UPI003CEC737A